MNYRFSYQHQAHSTLLKVEFPKALVDSFKTTFHEAFWDNQRQCWLLPQWWQTSLEEWMWQQSRTLDALNTLRHWAQHRA